MGRGISGETQQNCCGCCEIGTRGLQSQTKRRFLMSLSQCQVSTGKCDSVIDRTAGTEQSSHLSRRVYDEAVQQVLIVAWEASDRICSKRLKSVLPLIVEAMERHGHLDIEQIVRDKVLAVSGRDH